MRFTGKGVISTGNGKKDIFSGDEIPSDVVKLLGEKRIEAMKKAGEIDGVPSPEAMKKIYAQVEENKKKSEGGKPEKAQDAEIEVGEKKSKFFGGGK